MVLCGFFVFAHPSFQYKTSPLTGTQLHPVRVSVLLLCSLVLIFPSRPSSVLIGQKGKKKKKRKTANVCLSSYSDKGFGVQGRTVYSALEAKKSFLGEYLYFISSCSALTCVQVQSRGSFLFHFKTLRKCFTDLEIS